MCEVSVRVRTVIVLSAACIWSATFTFCTCMLNLLDLFVLDFFGRPVNKLNPFPSVCSSTVKYKQANKS